MERCGHCDNCLRNAAFLKHEDKTLEAWQILKIAEEIYNLRGRVTIAILASLAGGGRQSQIQVKQKRGAATEVQLDLERVAGGKVDMSVSVSYLFISLRPFINLFLDVERT